MGSGGAGLETVKRDRLLGLLKGVFLFGLFYLISGVIGALLITIFVGRADLVAASFHDAIFYAAGEVVGVISADAFLRLCFRSSYPRKTIIDAAIIIWIVAGVIFGLVVLLFFRRPYNSVDWVRPFAFILTMLYLRWDERRRRRLIATVDVFSDTPTPREGSFMDGMKRLFASLAMILPQLFFFVWGLAQLVAVYAQVHAFTHLPGFLSGIVALFLTYIPIVGSIIGFFGAKDVWGWEWWQVAMLYWGAPILLMIISIVVGAIGSAAERSRA
jgi:hypothetical protein